MKRNQFILVCAAIALLLCTGCFLFPTVEGSGFLMSSTYVLSGFTKIEASNTFKVRVVQDSTWAVTVISDDNLPEYLDVSQDYGCLKLGLKFGYNYYRTTLTAEIHMPALNGLGLSGASEARVEMGFPYASDLNLSLSGASEAHLLDCPTGSAEVDIAALKMYQMSMKEHAFFNRDAEIMDPERLRALQLERLRATVKRIGERNALQRKRLQDAGASAAGLSRLDDIVKLPQMDKGDFRAGYPLAMSCVETASIAEMHMSSGSTGVPVVMPYTQADILQWAECMARCYCMAGVGRGDVIQITPSFGLFNGGFGFYHGARLLGLFVIPTGAGNTPRQLKLARDFKTRVLTGVVSYGIRIMEVLEEEGKGLPDLKIGIFGAEVFSTKLKEKFAEKLGIDVFDIYGMTETGGVGTLGMDCPAHDGLHVWEDHYIAEILDPKTHEPVRDGEMGELAVTSLTREALPIIRFRTGDLTRIVSRGTCACGRTHVRIAPITGRVDDMLIVKGVNFFPSQVEQALMEIPGVRPHYQIIIEDADGVKDVRVNVEAEPGVTGFMVEKHLKEALGFSPKGDVFKPGELPRQEGKAQRVFFKTTTNGKPG